MFAHTHTHTYTHLNKHTHTAPTKGRRDGGLNRPCCAVFGKVRAETSHPTPSFCSHKQSLILFCNLFIYLFIYFSGSEELDDMGVCWDLQPGLLHRETVEAGRHPLRLPVLSKCRIWPQGNIIPCSLLCTSFTSLSGYIFHARFRTLDDIFIWMWAGRGLHCHWLAESHLSRWQLLPIYVCVSAVASQISSQPRLGVITDVRGSSRWSH